MEDVTMRWVAMLMVVVGCAASHEPERVVEEPVLVADGGTEDAPLPEGLCAETVADIEDGRGAWPTDCRDLVRCPMRDCMGCLRWRGDSPDAGRYTTRLAEPGVCR